MAANIWETFDYKNGHLYANDYTTVLIICKITYYWGIKHYVKCFPISVGSN